MAEEYDPVTQRALFAQRFIGTTNLEQRRRFQQDITEAQDRDEARRAAEFEARQQANPSLMTAVTGRKREERLGYEGRMKQNLAEHRFQFDVDKAEKTDDLATLRLGLQERTAARLERKEARDLKDAVRTQDETDALEEVEFSLRDKGLVPGMRRYNEEVLNIIARTPYADPQYRAALLKGIGIKADPNEVMEQAAAIREQNPDAALTISPTGGITMRLPAKTPKKEKAPTPGRMDSLRDKMAKQRALPEEQQDKDYLSFLQSEFEKEKTKVNPGSQASTQTPSASNNFTDPDSFKKAFQSASPGTVLMYNGKPWRKP